MRNVSARGNKYKLAIGAAAIALTVAGSNVALAAPVPAPGQSNTIQVNIAAGDLGKALTQLGREAGVQIAFLPDRVRGRKARALRGSYTLEEALDRLLAGTGLRYTRTPGGSYVVGGPTEEAMDEARKVVRDEAGKLGYVDGKLAVPDILVRGTRWTLNTDIRRTENDPQPYVVFTHDQIERSGAHSLEDFFRDYLGANTTGSNSNQQRFSGSTSIVNLRGFGTGGTLILIDGRRYAEVNTGAGTLSQSSINGIALDSIERVEVLASSASGIYGGNAVGGVINIITRRDYRGIEFNAYYGNSTRFDSADKRLSLNGSVPIEGGKTRLSFTGSWQSTQGLRVGDRDFVEKGRAFASANDPNFFSEIGLLQSTTPNIMSLNGNLVLKNGTDLGSNVTFIPKGFAGAAQAGNQALIDALIANAGKQNLEQPESSVSGSGGGSGKRAYLLTPSKSYSGSFAARRDFNKWLTLYGEFGYSHYENPTLTPRTPTTVTLSSTAANNPFKQSIQVSLPSVGQDYRINNVSNTYRALAGAIVKLPLDWQAFFDVNWSWGSYRSVGAPPGVDQATNDGLQNGTLDVLRDITKFPLTYQYLDSTFGTFTTPSKSSDRSYTLKLAGPVPGIKFWGGRPVLTVQFQQDRQELGDNVSYVNSIFDSNVSYSPKRSQTTRSVYGEIRIPVVGKDNHVPLIHEFELQVAGRYDSYTAIGANSSIACFPLNGGLYPGPLPSDVVNSIDTTCPGNQVVQFAKVRNHSANPTVAARWAVTPDIMFRGSYSTGYQPPYLNAVIKSDAPINGSLVGFPGQGVAIINVTDPLRGNEPIGQDFFGVFRLIPSYLGGNPDVAPETSRSWSAGIVLTPRFISGLRLSADWTRITQRNIYFQPYSLLGGGNLPQGQAAFDAFLAAHPERFTRGPASGGYNVGPITFIDASTANLSEARSEAIDFAASYIKKIGPGQLEFQANATLLLDLRLRNTDQSPWIRATGVVGSQFLAGLAALGGDKWKANGSIVYTTPRWSFGARAHYFGGYWYSTDHSVQSRQASARMVGQAYVDIFGSFKILRNTELSAGMNNVLDKRPPLDAATNSFYSFFGDPRRATFFVNLKQRF